SLNASFHYLPPGDATKTVLLAMTNVSGCAKLIVSLRATAKQSQSVAIASFHFVPLAMTNIKLILPKYLQLILPKYLLVFD
ncbi:MAG: hypothetical protein AAFR83_23830, partial [Cyanobacteria bacterium J06629_18]